MFYLLVKIKKEADAVDIINSEIVVIIQVYRKVAAHSTYN